MKILSQKIGLSHGGIMEIQFLLDVINVESEIIAQGLIQIDQIVKVQHVLQQILRIDQVIQGIIKEMVILLLQLEEIGGLM